MDIKVSTELFLVAMVIIYSLPFLIWRLGKTEYYLPLVVVQIITGIILGPGIMGSFQPDLFEIVFNTQVIQALNGIAWWSVIIFVWIAGIELELKDAWKNRFESGVTVSLALGLPFVFGGVAAIGMLMHPGWLGDKGIEWQFIVCIGMACAITALPILILFMEKLELLRLPIGQRILRYASFDDLATWLVLAIIQLELYRVSKQIFFLIVYIAVAIIVRKIMIRISESDRWSIGIIWLTISSLSSELAGLHFMFGAFLAGLSIDRSLYEKNKLDLLRNHVMMVMMPVFFLSTGLRTDWDIGTEAVFIAASILLIASVGGKILGLQIAGRILKWKPGEATLIGWLLQTKALIMIIFANILLDKQIITGETFTALLLMAVVSTMLTIPMATFVQEKMKTTVFRRHV
jgi:Kef-type K+ transport system membrane component KefB